MKPPALFVTAILICSCNTLKKNQSTNIENKSETEKLSVDSSNLSESEQRAREIKKYKSTDYKNYLNLKPTDPNYPAIYTIFENGKEVFRQEVQNGSIQSTTELRDSIFINDTIYKERVKIIYKYKYDTIHLENQLSFEADESQEPATLSLLLKLIPWWFYAIALITILILIFFKALKNYLKSIPLVGRFIK